MRFFRSTAVINLFVLLLTYNDANAQRDTVFYFFDSSFSLCTPPFARYEEDVVKDDSLWNAVMTNNQTNIIVFKGHYYDSLLESPEGSFEFFFDSGNKEMAGQFNNGNKDGLWLTWDEKGNIKDSSSFENGKLIAQAVYAYFESDFPLYYTFTDYNKSEITRIDYSRETGKKSFEQFSKNNYTYTETKSYYENGQLREDIIRKKDRVLTEHYFDENGNPISAKVYAKKMESENPKLTVPEFPGGIQVFMNYISKALKDNQSLQYEIGTTKEVSIEFYLDNKGRPYNIKLLNGTYSNDLVNTITRAMKEMPNWNMNGLSSFGPMRRTITFIL
jgi:antitoxin component YwqK of YwqJK toxin-antitoxin module